MSSNNHPNGSGINWTAVRNAGQNFAFVKATESTSYTNPYFRSDYDGVKNAGMARGPYHYARPAPPLSTAADQARKFVAVAGTTRNPGELPPTLDMEESGGLSPANLIAWNHIFLDTLEQLTGRTPIIYTYPYFWRTAMANTSEFTRYPLWIADYWNGPGPHTPLVGGWPNWAFWQYTATGTIPGVPGQVDLSRGNAGVLQALAFGQANQTAIMAHYAELGGAGLMGNPTSAEYDVPGGRAQNFSGGIIYWSPGTGARAVYGDILARYQALGGPGGMLGLPTSDEVAVPGGRANTFVGGNVYWSKGTGAHAVWGKILEKYLAVGGPGAWIGFPTSDEQSVAGGKMNTFSGGHIYYTWPTGANVVTGLILQRYLALGGPTGWVGFPTSDELTVPNGRASKFQGANIYWSAPLGVHEVHGQIRERYLALGGPDGFLGLPKTDEVEVPGGRGNTFSGGVVLWSPATGAHQVGGLILEKYQALGGTASPLRFPVTDETGVPGGRVNGFSAGSVYWSPSTGAHSVSGAILRRYVELGGVEALGFPVRDQYAVSNGLRSDFQKGSLTYDTTTKAVTASSAGR